MDRGRLEDELGDITSKVSTSIPMSEMVNMLSYAIWGAAVTTTRAFDKVTLKIDADTSRIFVTIQLRWWAKFKKFELLHEAWLRRARKRVEEQTPEGWKVLVYYDRGNKK